MKWGDFSCLIFPSSHACLPFPLSSFLSFFRSSFFFPFFFPSSSLNLLIRMIGGHSAVMAVQTGGPKPLRYFFNLIAGFPLLSCLCVLPSPLSLFSLTLSLYYPGVWQAEPRWIALFYLHCASGWHCELDLGYSQVHVCVCAHVCVSVCLQV